MIDQPFSQFVSELAARSPAPGGGAAAAYGGAMGTALLCMVVRFVRNRPEHAKHDSRLGAAETKLVACMERMLPMAERDAAVFERVSAAYQLPKGDELEASIRKRAIQESLAAAMVVPEEVVCLVRDAMVAAHEFDDLVGRNLASDLGAAAVLLGGAAEAAELMIKVNASYLDDRSIAGATIDRVAGIRAEILKIRERIRTRVGELIDV